MCLFSWKLLTVISPLKTTVVCLWFDIWFGSPSGFVLRGEVSDTGLLTQRVWNYVGMSPMRDTHIFYLGRGCCENEFCRGPGRSRSVWAKCQVTDTGRPAGVVSQGALGGRLVFIAKSMPWCGVPRRTLQIPRRDGHASRGVVFSNGTNGKCSLLLRQVRRVRAHAAPRQRVAGRGPLQHPVPVDGTGQRAVTGLSTPGHRFSQSEPIPPPQPAAVFQPRDRPTDVIY